jgi:5'-nucleotidase
MTWLLATNDDGIDSPALPALASALAGVAETRVVAPAGERSWIGKAMTRHDPVLVHAVERDGIAMHAVEGTPADCVQLGVHTLFDEPPEAVVSGINIGYNYGTAFLLSSGTVGGAAEGWLSGRPAVALSAGVQSGYDRWAAHMRSPASAGEWRRLAAVAAEIVEEVLEHGVGSEADVLAVNLPADADLDTGRVVTGLARVGYRRLFRENGDGSHSLSFGGGFVAFDDLADTDIEAVQAGRVAITPVVLARTGRIDRRLRAALERSAG